MGKPHRGYTQNPWTAGARAHTRGGGQPSSFAPGERERERVAILAQAASGSRSLGAALPHFSPSACFSGTLRPQPGGLHPFAPPFFSFERLLESDIAKSFRYEPTATTRDLVVQRSTSVAPTCCSFGTTCTPT